MTHQPLPKTMSPSQTSTADKQIQHWYQHPKETELLLSAQSQTEELLGVMQGDLELFVL
jgi:hypothetical protein